MHDTQQMNGQAEPEAVDVALIEGGEALEAVDRAAIDTQIATAKSYPRSVRRFHNEAESLACLDKDTAGECFYSLPRSGKRIEGPSARLAEIIAYAWGNMRAEADIVGIDDKFVTAMGTCFDLERNVAVRVRVKRRITDRHGKRYGEDMIMVTSNAAVSIALRNAVFKVVPKALWKPVYEKARKASIGKGTLAENRDKAFKLFREEYDVEPERVLAVIDRESIADVKVDDLITLRGLYTALKEGDTTVDQAFARPGSTDQGASDLNARIRERQEEGTDEGASDAPEGELPL